MSKQKPKKKTVKKVVKTSEKVASSKAIVKKMASPTDNPIMKLPFEGKVVMENDELEIRGVGGLLKKGQIVEVVAIHTHKPMEYRLKSGVIVTADAIAQLHS